MTERMKSQKVQWRYDDLVTVHLLRPDRMAYVEVFDPPRKSIQREKE